MQKALKRWREAKRQWRKAKTYENAVEMQVALRHLRVASREQLKLIDGGKA